MYTAIKNYCNNGNNNGLFLLDMPTGYGKTYSVLEYIYEASLDESTPEKFLLRFCEKAKVIGISATATVPTVIGNYDLDYLKSKMQTAFSLPSEADKARLRSDFSKSLCGYDNVSINVELLGGSIRDNYSASAWEVVFDSDEISKMIFDQIERELPDSKDNYHKERYIRIALAYKQFVLHNDIQSFLCVLTKHPRKGDKYLNKDVLDEIFKCIIAENSASINVNSSVFQLDGDEYGTKKDEITCKLSEGQKLFIISVYQTIGAGQNLQYKIPRGLEKELIKINDRPSRGEKDFDAIYLDKPTNLLVALGNNLSEEEFAKYLYHTEFFQEASELSMYLKGKSSLMIFDRHANLKYKYGNRHFWCRGYYVDTVGRNEKAIKEYIHNQLQEDIASDQMCLKGFKGPFTGEPVVKGK